ETKEFKDGKGTFNILTGKDATDYIYRKGFEGAIGKDAVTLFVNRQMNQYSFKTIKALRDTFLKYYQTDRVKMDVVGLTREMKAIIDGDANSQESQVISQDSPPVNQSKPQGDRKIYAGNDTTNFVNRAIGLGAY